MKREEKILILYILYLLLLSTSCVNDYNSLPQGSDIRSYYLTSIPYIIDDVWPSPGSTITQSDYFGSFENGPFDHRGIGGTISLDNIDVLWAGIQENIYSRVEMYINSNRVNNNTFLGGSGMEIFYKIDEATGLVDHSEIFDVGPYSFSWALKFEPGEYVCLFQILNNQGVYYRFYWDFSIIDG